jgi:Polysaccharide pyruvyl transferase
LIPIDEFTPLTSRDPGPSRVKVIMNGYFTCNPDSWPPPAWIEPLFVSFHLSDMSFPSYPSAGRSTGKTAAEILLSGRNLEYFKQHQPIGCRDQATVERFRSAGVHAYFTGCLTLTLNSSWHASRDKIYIVDVNCDMDALIGSIPQHLRGQVVVVTHDMDAPSHMSQIERFAAAHELLMMYSSARVVVTSRLHCALPCLALGTSVLFLEPPGDLSRLVGLRQLFSGITSKDITNHRIDWEAPPPNPSEHLLLADRLTATVTKFISGSSLEA